MVKPEQGASYRGNVNGAVITVTAVNPDGHAYFKDQRGRKFYTNVQTFERCDITRIS